MYNQDNDQSRKALYAIIGIIAAFILIIVTISIIVVNANKHEANVLNESSRDDTKISDKDMSDLKTTLYSYANNSDENVTSDSVDASVRWDTVTQSGTDDNQLTTFLVDLDDYQQTYKVTITGGSTLFSCPELGLSKYPESFCVGNTGDTDDSIGIVFGSSLPLRLQTDDGHVYTVSRNSHSRNDGSISIQAYYCNNIDAVTENISESLDEYITSLGASPKIFKKDISVTCPHGE